MSPATRYTLRRNTASMMEICFFLFFENATEILEASWQFPANLNLFYIIALSSFFRDSIIRLQEKEQK